MLFNHKTVVEALTGGDLADIVEYLHYGFMVELHYSHGGGLKWELRESEELLL
jgi:hypothetical protein